MVSHLGFLGRYLHSLARHWSLIRRFLAFCTSVLSHFRFVCDFPWYYWFSPYVAFFCPIGPLFVHRPNSNAQLVSATSITSFPSFLSPSPFFSSFFASFFSLPFLPLIDRFAFPFCFAPNFFSILSLLLVFVSGLYFVHSSVCCMLCMFWLGRFYFGVFLGCSSFFCFPVGRPSSILFLERVPHFNSSQPITDLPSVERMCLLALFAWYCPFSCSQAYFRFLFYCY